MDNSPNCNLPNDPNQSHIDMGSGVEHESEDEATCSGPSLVPKRKPCEYGEKCYRRNPAHKMEFSHPGDMDYWDPVSTSIDPDLDTRPGQFT